MAFSSVAAGFLATEELAAMVKARQRKTKAACLAETTNFKTNLGAGGICPERVVTKARSRGKLKTPTRRGGVWHPA